MKTKSARAPKAFEPYTREEIQLILSLTPTYGNVKNLAKSLGRTNEAIQFIYKLAYSRRWLKEWLEALGPHQDDVATKIAVAKKRLGIFVGYEHL